MAYNSSTDVSNKRTKEALEKYRKVINASVVDSSLVVASCDIEIQRDEHILSTMSGLDATLYDCYSRRRVDNDERVKLCTYLVSSEKPKGSNNKSTVQINDLSSIDPSIPVFVWFHGGGMISGVATDPIGTTKYAKEFAKEQSKIVGQSEVQILVVSIEYRLSPEYPFPAGIIDCLSAMKFVLETSCSKSINIGGISAGGNMAAVVALECHRRYPGKVKSALIHSPMLSPETDSKSYFMNSTSSGACPASWLRWCWRAYLDLGEYPENSEDDPVKAMRDLLQKSEMKASSELWRLCTANEIPPGLDKPYATKFVVTTAIADVLCDDGIGFAKRLEENGANVCHIPAQGSHVFAHVFDSEAAKRLNRACRSVMFD